MVFFSFVSDECIGWFEKGRAEMGHDDIDIFIGCFLSEGDPQTGLDHMLFMKLTNCLDLHLIDIYIDHGFFGLKHNS